MNYPTMNDSHYLHRGQTDPDVITSNHFGDKKTGGRITSAKNSKGKGVRGKSSGKGKGPQKQTKGKKDTTLAAIDKINHNREMRRKKLAEKKKIKEQRLETNKEMGIK